MIFCPSNHMSKFISGVFRFFRRWCAHLPFSFFAVYSCRKSNFARSCISLPASATPFFQITHRQHICLIYSIWRITSQRASTKRSSRASSGVLGHSALSNLQQIANIPSAARKHSISSSPGTDGYRGTLQLDHSCSGGRFSGQAEVQSQLCAASITAQIEQPCHKVDHIPFGTAAEAEKNSPHSASSSDACRCGTGSKPLPLWLTFSP